MIVVSLIALQQIINNFIDVIFSILHQMIVFTPHLLDDLYDAFNINLIVV